MLGNHFASRDLARRVRWLEHVGRELRVLRIALGRSEPQLVARIDAALNEADRLHHRLKLRSDRPSSGHQGGTPC